MSRRRQDFWTWAVAIGILISQATPWVPEKPYIIGAAIGLLGVVPIRKAQDAVNRVVQDQEKDDQAVEP